MRTSCPNVNLGFLHSRNHLLYRMDKKSEIFTFFGTKSLQQFFSEISVIRYWAILWLYLYLNLPCRGKLFFQGSYCTFSKCSVGLNHCRLNVYSFSFIKFFKASSKFGSVVNSDFRGSIFYCIHSQRSLNRLFGIFCFHSFCIYGSSDRSWQTRRYFTLLFFSASLSTYAKSIYKTSFLNLKKAFILLKVYVAEVKFVKEASESKNCLNFAFDRLLVFSKLCTNP